MTTIAYKNGIIAYDSQITNGDVISDSDFDKCVIHGDMRFYISGATSDFNEFIAAYIEGRLARKDVSCAALLVNNGVCYRLGSGGNEEDILIWKHEVTDVVAIGSGSSFAYAAMDMGASAKRAVEIAIGRDIYSGGRVRTYKLK